jgi:hypothetical protein
MIKKICVLALIAYSNLIFAAIENPSCNSIYATNKYFTESDSHDLPYRSTYFAPIRGEFEKTDAFKKRAALEEKKAQDKDMQISPSATSKGLVKFKTDVIFSDYDADKELLKVRSYALNKISITTGKKEKPLYGFITERGQKTSEAYVMGVVKESSQSFGVIYSTKLHSKFLIGKGDLTFHISPELAKQYSNTYSLVIAGNLIPPYNEHKYYSSDNLAEKKMISSTDNYVIIDASCAAIIDRKTNKIIYEIK